MLTTDDLSAISLFSTLKDPELRELCRVSADMNISAGEYAVHEGEEPALFVVLSGKLEVTKRVDGIERKIGERRPGVLFGEVPLVYGTQFQGSYRAVEPSRVHAARRPALLRPRRRRARGRPAHGRARPRADRRAAGHRRRGAPRPGDDRRPALGPGLPRAAAVPHQQPDHLRLDHSRRAGTAERAGSGRCRRRAIFRPCSWPTARRWCGRSRASSPVRLGLQTAARLGKYDTIIVGGGPAGLAAAVYGASEGLRTW